MLEINFRQQNSNLWGQGHCFKVTDQIKYSINESLITFDIGQWVLTSKPNISLECIKCFRLTYCGYRQAMVTLCGQSLIKTKSFLILKSIFSLNLCQVLQGCLLFLGLHMFLMVTRLSYRTKNIDFEIKFFFRMYQCFKVICCGQRQAWSL